MPQTPPPHDGARPEESGDADRDPDTQDSNLQDSGEPDRSVQSAKFGAAAADTVDRNGPVKTSSVDSAAREDAAISEFHRQKLRERRQEWQFNTRLASISAAVIAIIVVLGISSYFYNSNAAAQTFRLKAEEAAQSGDAAEESRWWARYLMMVPGDAEVVVNAARAADAAADQAAPEDEAQALTNARRRLADSLARLDSAQTEEVDEIRRRLIRRQIQSGGLWFKEAEHQIVNELKPADDDLFAHKALALAVFGQIQSDIYNKSPVTEDHNGNYWKWLSSLSPHLLMQRSVELMPADLDCIAVFAETVRSDANSGDSIDSLKKLAARGSDDEKWLNRFGETKSVVRKAVKDLHGQSGGRAMLTLYSYLASGTDKEKAAAQRMSIESGQVIADRLASNAQGSGGASLDTKGSTEAVDSNASKGASASTGLRPIDERLVSELVQTSSAGYWDFQALLQSSQVCAGLGAGQIAPAGLDGTVASLSEDEQSRYQTLATKWYETLIAASVPDVTAKMRETAFLYAGIHAEVCGDGDRALEIWSQGLTEISVDNLELNGAIVSRLVRDARTDEEYLEADAALTAYGNAIEAERNRLLLSSAYQLTQAQRNQAARLIEIATWRYNVAGAELAILRDGGTEMSSDAIRKYQEALASSAPVRSAEKSLLARNLASLYYQHGVYDQAADALSTASDLQPTDVSLHVLAGEAWTKAGNRNRAAHHWKMAGAAPDLSLRVKAAQAQFDFMLRSPPGVRDFGGVRTTVPKLEREFEERLKTGEGLPSDPPAIAEIEASIRVLRMSIPPVGVLAEQHLASKGLALDADALANELNDNSAIQAYAAGRLAAVGLVEKASRRIERLEELEGKGSVVAEKVRAGVEASSGKASGAAQRLLEAIAGNPASAAVLARTASNYFLADQDVASSYKALQRIPDDRRLPSDLYQLYRHSKQLVESMKDIEEKQRLASEASEWRAELKEVEEPTGSNDGENVKSVGTFWRMIEVEEKLIALQSVKGKLPLTDPRVIEIRDLLSEIKSQRPRWGRVISMQGLLAARLENHKEAIEYLRAGIDAGDRSLRTRQLLLSELLTLDLTAEAEDEMRRMAMSVDFVVDPYARQDIRSAFNRGELVAAVGAARESASKKLDDVEAQLLFARVASTAVGLDQELAARGGNKAKMQPGERDELIVQARQAIERAQELADEDKLQLASAALDIEFRHGTPESIEQVWKRVAASDLPEHEMLLLNARVLMSQGDIDGAIAKLKESNLRLPSAATNMQLAQLYQMQGQSVDMVATLRDAVKMQPENQRLRTELAKAIVVHEGESADWKEVEALLRLDAGATPDDRFALAALLSARGDRDQLMKALGIVRQLVQEQGTNSYEASVLQVSVLVKLVNAIDIAEASQSELGRRQRFVEEAKGICVRLAGRRKATSVDLYRYATFLLKYGEESDLERVKSLENQLASMPSGMLQSLQLGIVYNQKVNSEKSVPDIVEGWAERVQSGVDGSLLGGVETAAGQSLFENGYIDEGLRWFEKSYQANPDALAPYVIALAKSGQHARAAEVSASHFRKHGDVTSATMLVEALLALGEDVAVAQYSEVVQDAIEKHARNAALLEGVATWAMQRGKNSDAIKLYQRVLGLDPLRIRSLNNISMSYAQIPGRASDGLVYIDRALKRTNRNPEILDTKGTVLMKAGRSKEALQVLDEAISKGDEIEPRFQFHKILALLALGRQSDAKSVWEKLDVSGLDQNGLTKDERELLQRMKTDFKSFIQEQI